jgi:hypothetical protein
VEKRSQTEQASSPGPPSSDDQSIDLGSEYFDERRKRSKMVTLLVKKQLAMTATCQKPSF